MLFVVGTAVVGALERHLRLGRPSVVIEDQARLLRFVPRERDRHKRLVPAQLGRLMRFEAMARRDLPSSHPLASAVVAEAVPVGQHNVRPYEVAATKPSAVLGLVADEEVSHGCDLLRFPDLVRVDLPE